MVCSLYEGATAPNSVGDIDYSIRVFDESVLSIPDHDQNIMDESVLSVPDPGKTMVDEIVLSVPEHDKTMMDERVTLEKNEPIVILKDIRTALAESNYDSN